MKNLVKSQTLSIQKVAELSGVSVATVSRVLNNNGPVSPSTRQKVESTIKELNYIPNGLARNFRMATSHTILVILAELSNPFYIEIIRGISEIVQAHNYDILICETHANPEKQVSFLRKIENKMADGAIVLDSPLQESQIRQFTKELPIVQCAEYNPDLSIPYVTLDNRKGGYIATDYLIKHGHRKIAFIGTEKKLCYNTDRKKGYIQALEDAGIPLNPEYIINCNLGFEGGMNAAKQLLELSAPPTALFFVSDMLAVGAVNFLNSNGYHVPDDIAVMGFDNIEMCKMVLPHITTVAQPMIQMGRRAAEMLFRLMQNSDSSEYTNSFFHPEIVERNSV